jgi:hypothetical protein
MAKKHSDIDNAMRARRMQVTVSDRLQISSEELQKWLAISEGSGTSVTVREDLTIRISNRG